MPEKSARKPFQRILTMVFGLAFLGSMTGFTFSMFFNSPVNQREAETAEENSSIDPRLQELQERESGYRQVLEREPNNKFALENLAKARLQMQDYQGAIQPLEKLRELEPENQTYLQVLVDTKLKMNDYQGAIEPMEKLIQLYPDAENLQVLLAESKTKSTENNVE